MQEDQKNWDEALAARRKYNQISPDSAGFLNTSYLLVLTNFKVALEIAHFALETAEKGPYVYVTFNEQ